MIEEEEKNEEEQERRGRERRREKERERKERETLNYSSTTHKVFLLQELPCCVWELEPDKSMHIIFSIYLTFFSFLSENCTAFTHGGAQD